MAFDRRDYIVKEESNPILGPWDFPGTEASAVFNPGVTKLGDDYVMLFRIENAQCDSRNYKAVSKDGLKWDIVGEVLKREEQEPAEYHRFACDIRICPVEDTYYITYCIGNAYGAQSILQRTDDFETYENLGVMCEPNNRNIVLFPRKINGMYYRLSRPFGDPTFSPSAIWIAESPDLVHWGRPRALVTPRSFAAWDNFKLGASLPPIESEEGWIIFYHGTTKNCNNLIYRASACLLDLDDPTKVISRPREYLLGPEHDYERVGDVPNVCFPSGVAVEDNGDLKIYYGAADTFVALAYSSIEKLADFCLKYKAD